MTSNQVLSEVEYNVVGKRPVRPDGVDKVTGRARFGADLFLPGMLVGRVLRSPHAHARIKSIDTSKAEALPGVKAVVTRDDFKEMPSESVAAGEMMIDYRDRLTAQLEEQAQKEKNRKTEEEAHKKQQERQAEQMRQRAQRDEAA